LGKKQRLLLQQLKTNGAKIIGQVLGNMWKGIIGFHLSHSMGMTLFSVLFIAIGIQNPAYLESPVSLNTLLFGLCMADIGLAQLYWFSVPRNGFIASLLCFICYAALR
jgi:hypothetical protein